MIINSLMSVVQYQQFRIDLLYKRRLGSLEKTEFDNHRTSQDLI